jgi:hypothetical protein
MTLKISLVNVKLADLTKISWVVIQKKKGHVQNLTTKIHANLHFGCISM